MSVNRILWNYRPNERDMGGDIDEIVVHNPEMIHIEQMNEDQWWIAIYMDSSESYWMGNFTVENNILTFGEYDYSDFEWDEDRSHEEPKPQKIHTLKNRHIYKVQSRNIKYGVYDASSNSFIGVRYNGALDEQLSRESALTVLEELEELPKEIHLWTDYPGDRCIYCGGDVDYNASREPRWLHEFETECTLDEPLPGSKGMYLPLLEYLKRLENF